LTLIKSISGIRGTIGGSPGEALTPLDIVKFTGAFGALMTAGAENGQKKIVIGRDARVSGHMVSQLVSATLIGQGINVVDLGLATTPTVELAVVAEEALGGIIITASHNPGNWNALKLLDASGEFISAEKGQQLLEMVEKNNYQFADVNKLGVVQVNTAYLQYHIQKIVELPLVDVAAIKARDFSIAVDAVNSVGGVAVPMLLKALGVDKVKCFYCEPDGHFPHNPEPLPENLTFISSEVAKGKYDLGIVVDPDVDRLALICEDGSMFGEEYTLVAVADYYLQNKPGNTVSNLSSTKALEDITIKVGGKYIPSAVGEVNVVQTMKTHNAIIGGEGNGGIIVPELHYGRDALAGIALFLSHLARFGKSASRLRATYPSYFMNKSKIELTPDIDLDKIIEGIKQKYKKEKINTIDGLRIDFQDQWVHLRKSNTEPIIRIYAESDAMVKAESLCNKIIADIKDFIHS
jgi:phosphomannomutase